MTQYKVKTPALVPGFFHAMDRILNDDFSHVKSLHPATNIIENEKDFCIELMAAGLQKSDFKIELNDDLLTISFTKEESKEDAKPTFIKKEFSTKSFSRSFHVNEHLKVSEISAKYENGILFVSIPKNELKEKEVKTIIIE